jgi:hypothetical protein
MEQSEPLVPTVRPHLNANGDQAMEELVAQFERCALAVLARIGFALRWFRQGVKRMWGKSWTVETLSWIVSIMALVGLIATLLAHQSKPLPQWPQLVTINSIMSLFSLIMRTCVGVVLTEGTLQPHSYEHGR